ncbi:TPA: Eaa protein [Escherichia coli]|nr:Eaa protein [Escherichia coli]HCN8215984.1 Eaa protein [Escherichia coli]HCQ3744702.1 Eaa protein [Escherichia coli]
MSAITKERIELFIKNPLDNGLTRGEQMELARIALTSLEAEPVAYIIQDSDARSRGEKGILRYFANISDEDINEYEITVTPLYAAPPETVSVPDAMEMDDDFDSAFEHGKAVGWNAYRAAMFQSGNFRENKNSSTNNFREIAETSTNYPVITSEVLSAIQKVAKIRADFDDFDGDRRGIGDCLDEAEQELIVTINKYASQLAVVLVGLDERAAFNAWNNEENLPIAGVSAKNAAWLAWQARAELGRSLAVNSPVTPDGWISCSERTSGKQVIELTMLVKQLVSQLKKAKPDCKLPDRAMDYLLRNGLISVEGVLR